MQAVILAAGVGSRLNGHANEIPKCLTEIDGRPLLEYQLSVLRKLGIRDVCTVVGAQADRVRSQIGERCHYIVNTHYEATNSLYSLWLARRWVSESLLVSNGDLLASPAIYDRLLSTPGNTLAYDSSSGADDEHMKVCFHMNGALRCISKSLPLNDVDGESIGLIKYEANAVAELFFHAEEALRTDGREQWSPAALNRLAEHEYISGVEVADLPWVEIDFPHDLDYARRHVWPAICSQQAPPASVRHLPEVALPS